MKKFCTLLSCFCLSAFSATGVKISDYSRTATLGNNDLFLISYWGGSNYTTNKSITYNSLLNQILSATPSYSKVYVAGSLVNNPNFISTQFAIIGTNVYIGAGAPLTNIAAYNLNAQDRLTISNLTGILNAANGIVGVQQTGSGFTNISGVSSINIAAGANTTFTTNANGQISIASSGGGGGGGVTGTLINTAASTAGQLAQFMDTTKTNIQPISAATNFTLVTPIIASFVNSTHNHQNAAGGGTLDAAALGSGTISQARLGSGSGGTGSKFLADDQTYKTVSGAALSGTMISDGSTFSSGSLAVSKDTTGTNFSSTATLIITGTNIAIKGTITADNLIATNGVQIGSGGTNLPVVGNVLANGGVFTNSLTLGGNTVAVVGGNIGAATATTPAANDNTTKVATTAYVQQEISDYATDTVTLQNKSIATAGSGGNNTLKFTDYKEFIYPHRIDGTGTTIVTNDYTSGLSGLTTHAGTGGTNANYAFYRIGLVPFDLDTGVTMVLTNLALRVSGTDTGSASFSIGYFSPASSSAYTPSDFTVLSGYVNFATGTLTSPVANDTFYVGNVTLTGWASGLTAGRPLIIGIARDGGDANNDSITILGGAILFGRNPK